MLCKLLCYNIALMLILKYSDNKCYVNQVHGLKYNHLKSYAT